MNKIWHNFWLDLLLLITFIVVIISGVVLDNHDPDLLIWGLTRPAWVMIHAVSALATLAGVAIHLDWHFAWIKGVFKRSNRSRSTQVRRNRTVDLWLFGLLVALSLSGLLIWQMAGNLTEGNPLGDTVVLGLAYHDWKSLHSWSSVLMFIFMIVHLVQHWNWICSNLRSNLTAGTQVKEIGKARQ